MYLQGKKLISLQQHVYIKLDFETQFLRWESDHLSRKASLPWILASAD